jgi:hypothetical protein
VANYQITAFFGNGAQQQSLGVQDFLAVLRLVSCILSLSARLHPGSIASTSPTELIQLSDYMLGMDVLTSEIRIASWHTLVLALP